LGSQRSVKTTFTECAEIAYSLPKSSKHDDSSQMPHHPSDPVGIRRPFIEILRLTRFSVVHDSEFLSSLENIPDLMTDIVVAVGQWDTKVAAAPFPEACASCSIIPARLFELVRYGYRGYFATADLCSHCAGSWVDDEAEGKT